MSSNQNGICKQGLLTIGFVLGMSVTATAKLVCSTLDKKEKRKEKIIYVQPITKQEAEEMKREVINEKEAPIETKLEEEPTSKIVEEHF